MKQKLLLYLAKMTYPANTAVAATLAWVAEERGMLFDCYYDSYHLGIHYGGGDPGSQEGGRLTGGSVCGARHFQEFYYLLHQFDVMVVSTGESVFGKCIGNLQVPILISNENLIALYRDLFDKLKIGMPDEAVLLGEALPGASVYYFPEIFYRRALGLMHSIGDQQILELCGTGRKIYCFQVEEERINRLRKCGCRLEAVEPRRSVDSFLDCTARIAARWKDHARGWILGDPTLVAHWLPAACEQRLLPLYSVPQEEIITKLGELIGSKGNVIYGRQYSDRDFFSLSQLNQCLQVIDPGRPAFQTVRHAQYSWQAGENPENLFQEEFSDDELRRFAEERRVMVSLMFWSGMIREVENFHGLMDLVAMTRLKCGFVVTAQTYEYLMHAPFELLTVPLEDGGVFPHVEPVIGSCGVGVGIEACMTRARLQENLEEGLERIRKRVKGEGLVPRGWWVTMDADLDRRRWWERPLPLRARRHSPYLQIRYHTKQDSNPGSYSSGRPDTHGSAARGLLLSLRRRVAESAWRKFFDPYRPYEFHKPGAMKPGIIEAGKSAGLRYMFSKAAFNANPQALYIDDAFIALNYTSGQWDGWTPFETVNDLSDLVRSEKAVLKSGKAGWIVGTVDSCLWTFSGEMWRRGSHLFEIASYCAQGGNSGKLINAKPYTISRYARIIAETA